MRFRAIRGAGRSLACCSLFLGWSGRGCWWPYTDASCHAPWNASSARLSPLSERRPVGRIWVGLEATPRIELGMEVLQTSALPLGYVAAPFVTGILPALPPASGCTATTLGGRIGRAGLPRRPGPARRQRGGGQRPAGRRVSRADGDEPSVHLGRAAPGARGPGAPDHDAQRGRRDPRLQCQCADALAGVRGGAVRGASAGRGGGLERRAAPPGPE